MKNIKEALAAYGMESSEYEVIRHNENITCKVVNEGKTYVLRIHQPIEGFCVSLIKDGKRDEKLIRTEVELLWYMTEHGFSGLQQPVANLQGEYVTVLKNGTPVTLLSWVEGSPIKPEEGGKYAEELARLACRIHHAAKGFEGERIDYDNALCHRMISEIRHAAELGHLSEEIAEKCITEIHAVERVQKKLTERYGKTLIHADLSFGNILVTENGLIPIDFSLSGYASLTQEAGMLLSNYRDSESCEKVLEGFRKAGEEIDPTDADIFLSYSVLLFICAQHNHVYQEEWFKEALTMWCESLFIH